MVAIFCFFEVGAVMTNGIRWPTRMRLPRCWSWGAIWRVLAVYCEMICL